MASAFLVLNFSIKTANAYTATVVPLVNNVDNLIGQADATWRFTIDNDVALIASEDAVEITFLLLI